METRRKKTLPLDLAIEVFLWMPVKPILRFRCVSKSLCSLVDSQNFRKERLQRSMENKTNRKLIIHELHPQYSIERGEFYAASLSEDMHQPYWDEGEYEKLNHPFDRKVATRIRGYCNGILLLQIYETLVLWNSFTRRCKKLPLARKSQVHCQFGLGYDHVRDDYKVVMLSIDHSKRKSKVRVFSLKANSWGSLSNFPFAGFFSNYVGLFANNALYWFLSPRIGGYNYKGGIIVGFDLVNETFYRVARPEFTPPFSTVDQWITSFTSLSVSEGRLIITNSTHIHPRRTPSEKQVFKEFYVRENEGCSFTWRKLDSQFQTPLASSKKGDKVWLQSENRSAIICYDIQQKTEKKVLDLPFNNLVLVVCAESLEPVGDGSVFDGDVSWDSNEIGYNRFE